MLICSACGVCIIGPTVVSKCVTRVPGGNAVMRHCCKWIFLLAIVVMTLHLNIPINHLVYFSLNMSLVFSAMTPTCVVYDEYLSTL